MEKRLARFLETLEALGQPRREALTLKRMRPGLNPSRILYRINNQAGTIGDQQNVRGDTHVAMRRR